MSDNQDSELQQDLGTAAIFTIASGTMIGAGIFILPGPAAAGAGPASTLSFALAGLIALVATMCAVELATGMPKAGGPYYFASRAMGPLVGTVVGLGAWLALIFKGSFALVGLGWYVREVSPAPVVAVAVVGGVLLTLVNWVGAETTGKVQNVVVVALVAILAFFSGSGFLAADPELWADFATEGLGGIIATTGLVFISYLGIVKATAVAEEVKDPGKTLPRAMFAAVIFVTLLYVSVMLVVTGLMPITDIAESSAPVADAGREILGSLGGTLIAFAGILATLSTANAAILSSSRFPYSMSRDGLVSRRLGSTSERFGTPTLSIWLTGGIMVILAVVFDVEGLAKLGGTFGILVFALLNVTVVLLRRSQPEWYQPAYRAPFSPLLPLLGAVAALLLLPFMGLLSQVSAAAFIALGIVWYFVAKRTGEPIEPDYDVRTQVLGARYEESLADQRDKLDTEDLITGPCVLVEVAKGTAHPHLSSIMRALSHGLEADLKVVTITEVPPQVPLDGVGVDHDPDAQGEADQEWRERLVEELSLKDQSVTFTEVRTHSRTDALLDSIDDRFQLVLVDWQDAVEESQLRRSHVDEILRSKCPVRLAVLKYRGESEIKEIVVATETGPYDRAEVEVADAIAAETGASLALVKAIPEDTSEEAETSALDYLEELSDILSSPTEKELIRTDDVERALIERANRSDLVILGAPSRPGRHRDFFGQTTDAVAAATEVSVLVVKEPGEQLPLLTRLWRRLRRLTKGGEG